MFAYIKGKLAYKSPTVVYLDVSGVAYEIHISLFTYGKIEQLEEAKLYTYLHVKEDAQTLFGFCDEEEKTLFVQLLSVSGIGPNTARIILSSMAPIEVKTAIITENDVAFKKVKGVGPKTAKRVILDLKDKITRGAGEVSFTLTGEKTPMTSEALDALLALGFQKQKVQKVLASIPLGSEVSLEEIIKKALQKLT